MSGDDAISGSWRRARAYAQTILHGMTPGRSAPGPHDGAVLVGLLAILSFSTTCSIQQPPHVPMPHAPTQAVAHAGKPVPAPAYRRVEDLPVAPPQRVEDLPLAPPIATRPLRPDELTTSLIEEADRILWKDDPPLGTELAVEVDDRTYIARLEMHFHDVGGPVRPWGYHKGVTLYATE